MARNIIDLICNSCSCGKEEAQEYLDDEIRNLQELQADNDLRGEDFEIARRRLRNRVQQPRTRPGLADIFHQPSCRTLISTTMTYFQNIQSLADLKKEYRRLAMLHHPDKGGDTALMQQVNTEFGKLFEVTRLSGCHRKGIHRIRVQ